MAGHFGLDNLVLIYDNNRVTVDGSIDLCFTDDTSAKLKAMGWEVIEVFDGSNDVRLYTISSEEYPERKLMNSSPALPPPLSKPKRPPASPPSSTSAPSSVSALPSKTLARSTVPRSAPTTSDTSRSSSALTPTKSLSPPRSSTTTLKMSRPRARRWKQSTTK